MSATYRYLYLHGFGSSRDSTKGLRFRERLASVGIELELLDINVPDFGTQTYSRILAYLDEVDRSTPRSARLRIGGSSMGGYLAARWAELNPARVERLFLLCPGFDLGARWPILLGTEAYRQWERDGTLLVEYGPPILRPLHWDFVVDSCNHPAYPQTVCPTRIVHGVRDDVVPIEFSREYAARNPLVELIEVDDQHSLANSVERAADEYVAFVSPANGP